MATSVLFLGYLIGVYTLKFTPYLYFALILLMAYVWNVLIAALSAIYSAVVPREYFGHVTSIESVISLLLRDATLIGVGYLAQDVSVTLSLVVATLGVVIPSSLVYFKAKDVKLIEGGQQ